MNPRLKALLACGGLPLLLLALLWIMAAPDAPALTGTLTATGEVVLDHPAPAGQNVRLEASSGLDQWEWLATHRSGGTIRHTDSAGPYHRSRFYRAVDVAGTGILTGDHLMTSAGDLVIHPINHASFVMSWNGIMIYNDPVGGAARYTGIPKADLVVVTHTHGDHFDNATIDAVRNTGVRVFAPQSVFNGMSTTIKALTTVMANGATQTAHGVTVDAIPMYNISNNNHPQGVGNGYVLTIGGKRIYMSGDTEGTVEMRALQNIDVAFLCMSLPSNMNVTQAASAARDFRPRVVYPYHFRQNNVTSDLNSFKQQVGTDLGIEVRIRTWY